MNWMEKCFHVIILKLVSIGERNEHVCCVKAATPVYEKHLSSVVQNLDNTIDWLKCLSSG